ncbi:multiple organellar RNA editing factor 8, chloroplastic/mitochondrial [Beta vulgaris subsp. vulgaris]|uniref:multiple organellar RNA editing factor 8, chloroplastic/mitochondrial n=1 Tax=Beta vulgaris subsp. vulgaris TaxID=3555 RepID=UPI0020372A28|nr:multiple organellar RNA editing factor 8, chloroplastic/mitochondrial [Beta vulgaris subsp. vulgaris]
MAAPRILSVSRTLFTTTTKQTLASFLLSRPFSAATTTSSALSRAHFSLLRASSIALCGASLSPASSSGAFRTFATRQSQTSLSDNNSNWSNRPPKETILLDGCDFEHWLVVTEPPAENATRDDIIDTYIKTLAQIVGSEEEARMKIYSVSTKHYFAFGALVSEELSYKLKELPNVRWVLPDSYLDVKNKDYGGEPFINGQAVPYDPIYHEEWVRNNAKAQDRNRRNDRPRNADRSRNFDRRQGRPGGNMGGPGGNMGGPGGNMGGPGGNMGGPGGNMGGPGGNMGGPGGNMGGPGGNMGGPPNRGGPPNAGGMPNYPGGAPPNMPPNNAGYAPNMPPNNAGYAQNMPPNNAGYGQNMPPNNAGYGQNMSQNIPSNSGGMPPANYGGQGNPGYASNTTPNYQQGGGMPYQNTQMSNQNYVPQNSNMGGQPGGAYQPQDVPGRDKPNY